MKVKQVANKKARKKYTAQFKQQAVERADRDGVAVTARDLDVAESQLYYWRTQLRSTGESFENQKLQQSEVNRLKRENERFQQEVEFLKKAAAYFAKLPK